MTRAQANQLIAIINGMVDEDSEVGESNTVSEVSGIPGEPQAETSPRCQIHFYQNEPIMMIRRTTKDGLKHWYDHRTQIEGVWKKCTGQGYR